MHSLELVRLNQLLHWSPLIVHQSDSSIISVLHHSTATRCITFASFSRSHSFPSAQHFIAKVFVPRFVYFIVSTFIKWTKIAQIFELFMCFVYEDSQKCLWGASSHKLPSVKIEKITVIVVHLIKSLQSHGVCFLARILSSDEWIHSLYFSSFSYEAWTANQRNFCLTLGFEKQSIFHVAVLCCCQSSLCRYWAVPKFEICKRRTPRLGLLDWMCSGFVWKTVLDTCILQDHPPLYADWVCSAKHYRV